MPSETANSVTDNQECEVPLCDTVIASIEPIENLDALGDKWRSLDDRSSGSIFNSWPWVGTWLRLTRTIPYVFSIKRGDTDLALAIITKGTRSSFFIPLNCLYLNQSSCPEENSIFPEYTDILTARDLELDAMAILYQTLSLARNTDQMLSDWHVIIASGTQRKLTDFPSLDLSIQSQSIRRSPWIDLQAVRSGGNGHTQLMSPNSRYQVRRSERLFSQAGELKLEAAQTLDQAFEWLEHLIRLQRKKRLAAGQRSSLDKPFVGAFLRELVRAGRPGRNVEMLRLSVSGRTLGCTLNLIHKGVVSNYQSGFLVQDDNRLKPGMVCHSLSADYYAAQGFRIYNLLANASQYKNSLSTDSDTLYWTTISRPYWPLSLQKSIMRISGKAVP